MQVHSCDENDFRVFLELLDRYRTGSVGGASRRLRIHQEKGNPLAGTGGYLHDFTEVIEPLDEVGNDILVGSMEGKK